MNLYTLQNQLKTQSPYNFYVFIGTEVAMMKLYINRLSTITNKPVEWMDSLQECLYRISRSTLVTAPKLYVVQDDRFFMSKQSLWDKMSRLLKSCSLILIYSKAETCAKYVKKHEDNCLTFGALTTEALVRSITKQIALSSTNAAKLVEVCEHSYDRVLQELDKLKSYISYRNSIGSPISEDAAFRVCLSEGVIYQPIGDITFELVNAIVSRRDAHQIEKLLIDAKICAEPPLRVLTLLYTQYRNLMIYKSFENDQTNIEERSGLKPNEIRGAKYNADMYSFSELKSIIRTLQDLDYSIKTGGIDEQLAISYFIAKHL